MAETDSPNMAMLRDVVTRLEPLLPRLVFLGGIVTELMVTEPTAPPARVTTDVDVVIDVLHLGEYADTFREQLLALRLEEDTREGAPRCRWRFVDAPRQIVDIMPTSGDILGFSTRWYADAYEAATPFALRGGPSIRLITSPYFIATKLTAFRDRGSRDPTSSHDLEDVIAVIDGRELLVAEIQAAPADVRQFISSAWRELLATGNVPALLEAHLPPDEASQARASLVLDRIEAMARLS
jgi:hypothetical protein